jgi:hypothetical protein
VIVKDIGILNRRISKNELVQTQTPSKDSPKTTATPPKPNVGKTFRGNEKRIFWDRIKDGFALKEEEVKE